ncbi:hypothetical protein [Mycobacterium branderi]|uniref:Uncharacterized protein n=1 Tax=Mycobacterium branderi TaxID=43348 RepID=A0A7I7WDW3_9MYCO|nr:hypothetical protein [Mycobacterium branderi]MCV7236284.1 hypothetical protein [Mycobacterium branderi]ORA35458.1 hypothetical protein BST20_17865 [Mycobacterium branderi]BBZ15167.1 hypothetical protein MBRA_53620 [Mycobacterium branderi]
MTFPHNPIQYDSSPPPQQAPYRKPIVLWTISALCWVPAAVLLLGLHQRLPGTLLMAVSILAARLALANRAKPSGGGQFPVSHSYSPPPQQYPYSGGYAAPQQQYPYHGAYPPAPQQYPYPGAYPPPPQRFSPPR